MQLECIFPHVFWCIGSIPDFQFSVHVTDKKGASDVNATRYQHCCVAIDRISNTLEKSKTGA